VAGPSSQIHHRGAARALSTRSHIPHDLHIQKPRREIRRRSVANARLQRLDAILPGQPHHNSFVFLPILEHPRVLRGREREHGAPGEQDGGQGGGEVGGEGPGVSPPCPEIPTANLLPGDGLREQDGVRESGHRTCMAGGFAGAVQRGRGRKLLQLAAKCAAVQGGASHSTQGRHQRPGHHEAEVCVREQQRLLLPVGGRVQLHVPLRPVQSPL